MTITAKKKSSKRPALSSKKELEERARYEEFWSDPCWTMPLVQEEAKSCSGSY